MFPRTLYQQQQINGVSVPVFDYYALQETHNETCREINQLRSEVNEIREGLNKSAAFINWVTSVYPQSVDEFIAARAVINRIERNDTEEVMA